MSDKKFKLPGTESFMLNGQTIDLLIREGDGDAALLYLYILKTSGQSSSDEIASAMGKSAVWIASAMAVLSRLGLVQPDENEDDDSSEIPSKIHQNHPPNHPPNHPNHPHKSEPKTMPGYPEDGSVDAPVKEPRRYTIEEIKEELKAGSGFAAVVEETQRSLGRILSPDDLLRLCGIYDSLRLPPEVILQLITHCISESRKSGGGRAPSMRFIEKEAYRWEREGIFSLERAEEYLKDLETRIGARSEIKFALQIKNRELSETEKRFIDDWITMGFGPETIAIAYDRTVLKTGNMAWPYMDSILKSWHGRDIHTPREVLEKDTKPGKNTPKKGREPTDNSFGASDQEEIERMKRFREMLKNE